MLGWYNRISHDDYGILLKVRNEGLLNSVGDWYMQWSGRWAASFLLAGLLKLFYKMDCLWLFSILTLVFLFTSSLKFVGGLVITFTKQVIPSTQIWIYSGFFATSLFYLSFDIGETWFWVTGSVTYLWSVLALMLGIGLVLSENNSWYTWVGITLSFLFSGASNESLVVALVAMTGLVIYSYYRSILPKPTRTKLVWGTLIFMLALMSLVIAPGNMVRKEHFPEAGFVRTFEVAKVSYKILIKEFILPYTPYLSLFTLLWLYFGSALSKKKSTAKALGAIFIIIVLTGFLCFLAMIPTAYALVSLGPKRYLMQVSFFLAVSMALVGFCLGYYLKQQNFLLRISTIAILAITGLNIYLIITQYPIVKHYAKAEDQRIEFLRQEKASKRRQVLPLIPLPPSGLLKTNEITSDTNHFTNATMKELLELGYPIRIAVPEEWNGLKTN